MKVLYICDQERCEHCSASQGICFHTSDISHAINFEQKDDDLYVERRKEDEQL